MTKLNPTRMNWQQRLNEHEEKAPSKGWDNLRNALELDRSGLQEKLHALEAEPPAAAWRNIKGSLQTRDAHMPRLIPFLRRHAATVAIAASLLLVVYIFLETAGNQPRTTAGVAQTISSTQAPPRQKTTGEDTLNEPAMRPHVVVPSATQAQKPLAAPVTPRRSVPIQNPLPKNDENFALAMCTNYIEVCDRKGECDRLTYKLEEWASCLHAPCADSDGGRAERARRIEAWRSLLEHSTYIPAAGHFFDIGEMAVFLQSEDR